MFVVTKESSIYDLMYDYLSHYNVDRKSNEAIYVFNSFVQLLESGWCSDDIYIELNKHLNITTDKPTDLITYFSNIKIPKYNLLKFDDVRVHPKLLNKPLPTTVEYDIETGLFKTIESQYYLEQRASISFNDICKYVTRYSGYYCKETNSEQRIFGAIKYIYDTCKDVNIVLYAIDMAFDNAIETKKVYNSIMDVTNYIEPAKQKVKEKKSLVTSGAIEFVQKARVLYN